MKFFKKKGAKKGSSQANLVKSIGSFAILEANLVLNEPSLCEVISQLLGEQLGQVLQISSLSEALEAQTKKSHSKSKKRIGKRKQTTLTNKQSEFVKNSFEIKNFFSKTECDDFRELAEASGFESLEAIFEEQYRNHERTILFSQSLADAIFSRVVNYFENEDIDGKIPIGFGNAGIWRPVRCNECLKFNKYKEDSGHFSWHQDGPWTPSEDYASIYTLIVYLNNPRKGGETLLSDRFIRDVMFPSDNRWRDSGLPEHVGIATGHRADNIVPALASDRGIYSQTPTMGTALLFEHSMWHTGVAVEKGKKIILKTEVIFRRTDHEYHPASLRYMHDPEYRKAREFYDASRRHEANGERKKFVEVYKMVLEKQIDASESDYVIEENILSDTDLRNIFEYLTPRQVMKCMMVSRQWYIASRNSPYWKSQYLKRWTYDPHNWFVESEIARHAELLSVADSVHDWFNYYQARDRMSEDGPGINPLLLMIKHGACCMRPAHTGNTLTMDVLPTAVKEEIRGYHMRIRNPYRIFPSQYDVDWETTEREHVTDWPRFLSFVVGFYFTDYHSNDGYGWQYRDMMNQFGSSYHPLVFIEPILGWDEKEKSRCRKHCFEFLRSPAVHFINEAVAICTHQNVRDGIVLALSNHEDFNEGVYRQHNYYQQHEAPIVTEIRVAVVQDFEVLWSRAYDTTDVPFPVDKQAVQKRKGARNVARLRIPIVKPEETIIWLKKLHSVINELTNPDLKGFSRIIYPESILLTSERILNPGWEEQFPGEDWQLIGDQGIVPWKSHRGHYYDHDAEEVYYKDDTSEWKTILEGASLMATTPEFRAKMSFIL